MTIIDVVVTVAHVREKDNAGRRHIATFESGSYDGTVADKPNREREEQTNNYSQI